MRPFLPVHSIGAARCLFAAFAAAAALAGCTSDPLTNDLLTANIAQGSARKSVCVISAIGDTYSLQKVGLTVFGNALDKAQIEAWGVDAFVGGKIGSQLSHRFEARRIDYPKGAFAGLETSKSVFSSDYKERREELRDIVRGIVASQSCDLCLVVTKTGSALGNTNQSLYGLGILDHGSLVFTNVSLFALWEVRVYDGKTFAVLAHQRARSGEMPFMAVISGPHRKLDKSWWPAPGQIAQNAKLKQATLELIDQSMTAVIAELFPPR
jgi:hypothetical protein